jgi:hypothetical protein
MTSVVGKGEIRIIMLGCENAVHCKQIKQMLFDKVALALARELTSSTVM